MKTQRYRSGRAYPGRVRGRKTRSHSGVVVPKLPPRVPTPAEIAIRESRRPLPKLEPSPPPPHVPGRVHVYGKRKVEYFGYSWEEPYLICVVEPGEDPDEAVKKALLKSQDRA